MRKGLLLSVILLTSAGSLTAQPDIPARLPDAPSVQPKPLTSQPLQVQPLPQPPANGTVSSGTNVFVTRRETTNNIRVWGGTEYLHWWLKSGNTPPLVTTGNPLDPFPGALGQPGTSILFGGQGAMNYSGLSGGRVTFGIGLEGGWGIEFGGFWLQDGTKSFSRVSNTGGLPTTFIPVFQNNPLSTVPTPHEGSFVIADPLNVVPGVGNRGPVSGRIDIEAKTSFWGAEANAIREFAGGRNWSANVLIGYRYLSLDDSLTFSGFAFNPPPPTAPLGIDFRQDFREAFTTQNQFNGSQLGVSLSWTCGRLSFDLTSKIALGTTHSVVTAAGTLTESGSGAVNGPGPNVYNNRGALFVFPSNVGRQSQDRFSVMPQVTLKVGYNITHNLSATLGYDFLYWSGVARAGDQIDRRVNDSQQIGFGGVLVGQSVPAPQFNRTDFFAQGISVGLNLKY